MAEMQTPKPQAAQPAPMQPMQPKKMKSNYLIPLVVSLLAIVAFLVVINFAIQ